MAQLKMPRMVKFVTPKSPAPWDVASALSEMEHDAYQALVKEPAEAAGLPPAPELPGPAALASMFTAPLQTLFAGLGQGSKGKGSRSPVERGEITEKKVEIEAPVATRGSL
jgi:hypothetical protein